MARAKEMSKQAVLHGVLPGAIAYEQNVRRLRDARVLHATKVGQRSILEQTALGRKAVKEAAKIARGSVKAARASARVFNNTANVASGNLLRAAKSAASERLTAAHEILRNAGATFSNAKAARASVISSRNAAYSALREAVSADPGFVGFARGEASRISSQFVDDYMRASDSVLRSSIGLRRAKDSLRLAKAQGMSGILSASGRGQQIVTAARTFGDNLVRDAVASGRAAISSVGSSVAERVSAAKASSAAGIEAAKLVAPGLQSKALAVGDAVRSVGSGISDASGRVAKAIRRVNPFMSRAATSAPTAGKTASYIGKSVGWIAKYGTGVGEISGTLNGIERFVLNHTKDAGLGSKIVRGLTSAKSNALGFAIGSWVEAGLNAYDYYTDPNNKVGPGEITIGGRTAKFHEPGVLGAVASKEYVKEVAKGFGRVLTLGFWGSGDDTFLDKWAEGNRKANEDQLNEDIRLGRDPFTHKTLVDSEGNPLVADPGKGDAVIAKAKENAARDLALRSAGSKSLTESGFRDYLGKLVSEKSAKLQMVEDNVANWGEFSKTLRGPSITAESYRDTATRNFSKRYDGYIEAAMSNPMAKAVAETNRNQAYRLYTGRDYEKDYALEGAKAGSVEGFKEFNDDWNGLDDLQRTTWDYASEKKAYDAAVAAPVEEVK